MKNNFNRKLLAMILSVALLLNSSATAFAAAAEGANGAPLVTQSETVATTEETPPAEDATTESGEQNNLSDPEGSDKSACTCPPVDSGELTHGANCPLYAAEKPVLPEQADAVKNVLALIGALPTMDELAAQDTESAEFPAYLAQLRLDTAAARTAYNALTAEQKAELDPAVLAKLTELEGVLAAMPVLMNDAAITIKINGIDTEHGGADLQSAIIASKVDVDKITKLEITAGKVTVADWEWFASLKQGIYSIYPPKYLKELIVSEAVTEFPPILTVATGSERGKRVFPTTIESVIIPHPTTIGREAFQECTALKTVNIPKATEIGHFAFLKCSALTSANFPEVTTVGNSAFGGCASLTSISFPQVTVIPSGTLQWCTNLVKASFPKATSIADDALTGSPITTIELGAVPPPLVTSSVFNGFPTPRTLMLVDENGAPLSGSALTKAQTDYKAVNDGAEDDLWYGWKIGAPVAESKITIKINDSTTEIGGASLQAAVDTAIGANAYTYITKLTVTKGEVTADDWTLFKNLTALTNFTIDSAVTTVADMPNGRSSAVTIFRGQIATVTIPQAIKIGDYAFDGCSALTTASFPAATSIGKSTFNYCDALTTTSFPAVTSIGDNAFDGCANLTTASFLAATSIGQSAFYNCIKLTTASFPAATSIGTDAFDGCIALESASFPAATSIGGHAFNNCEKFATLKLGKGAPTADLNAFKNCPTTRNLKLVDASGTDLTGDALTTAQAAYTAASDGNTGDDFWYGWKIGGSSVNAPVTDVTLNKATLSLAAGKSEALTATVAPANATNKAVTWQTSNAAVATVTDGLVTAVKEGSATITVTTTDGGKTATCAVTVTAATSKPAPGGKLEAPLTQDKVDNVFGEGNATLGNTTTPPTIKLEKDITPEKPIGIETDVKIDLGGNTITGKPGETPIIVGGGDKVTIDDSGTIAGGDSTTGTGGNGITGGTGSEITIGKDVTVEGGNGTTGGDGINSGGTVTDNGKTEGGNGSAGNGGDGVDTSGGNGNIVIGGGGSASGGDSTGGNGNGGNGTIGGTGDIIINGGGTASGGNGNGSGNGGDGSTSKGDGDITNGGSSTGGNGGNSGGNGGNGTSTDAGNTVINGGGSSTGGNGGNGNGNGSGGNGGNGTNTSGGGTTVNGGATGGSGGNGSSNGSGGNGGNGASQGGGTVNGGGTATGGNGGNGVGTGNGGTGGAGVGGGATAGDNLTVKSGISTRIDVVGDADVKVELPNAKKAVDAVLTDEEKSDNTITDVKVTLKVDDKTAAKPDKSAIDAAKPTGSIIGAFFDITLKKTITKTGGSPITTDVTDTPNNQMITITIEIPDNMQGGSDYVVIRVHNGTGTALSTTQLGNNLTFDTNQFSTYAIAYTKSVAPPTPPTSNTSSGSSSSNDEYDFWMTVKDKIGSANSGDVIKVNAKSNDKMPESVMAVLRKNSDVTLVISWNGGKTITIPAGKAQKREVNRIYYPLSLLAELYQGIEFVETPADIRKLNPKTGGGDYIAYADGKQIPITGGGELITLEAPAPAMENALPDATENVQANTPAQPNAITPPTAGFEADAFAGTPDAKAARSTGTTAISGFAMLLAALCGGGVWFWKRRTQTEKQ